MIVKDNHSDSGDSSTSSISMLRQGQLKVSVYMNFGLLTVHVVQARQLSTKWKPTCDSFVKLSLIPDDGKKPRCKTEILKDSNNPLYDEKFSLEVTEEDQNKRLMLSVWHRDTHASVNEFLGCMSFGVRHLRQPHREVSGWYYLLTEDVGRRKHLAVAAHRLRPNLKLRSSSNVPAVNKDVWGMDTLSLTLHRGKHGFGFTVVDGCPARVGRVDWASPALNAGLQPGDIIIRLNKQNVSRSTATSVARLIKLCSNAMVLEVQRQKPITYEHVETVPDADDGLETCDGLPYSMDDVNCVDNHTGHYDDHTVPQMFTINGDEDKENTLNQTMYTTMGPEFASLATSTPLPLLARGHRTVQTSESSKQEAIHRLLTIELDFIDVMHAGMQRYSRPLRHCILSHSQHATLFQNIEKLTTISEYHVKQMHDNAPQSFTMSSEDDTDTSGSSDGFMRSIGLIYQSKVHMLCQAYDLYAKGISAGNQLLSDLRRNDDFVRFVREPSLESNQPSISSFIYRPVQHVRELYKVIKDLFANTAPNSPDYNSLKQITEGLQECTTNITNYSCERVESVSSLASRDSRGQSFTGSMRSRSSTTTCSSGSSRGPTFSAPRPVNTEVMKIQDRLVFSSNVPVFQLCADERHLLFSSDMFWWEGRQWHKILVFLFTDLLLLTAQEPDGFLRVLREPTPLRDIAAMDAQRSHSTEFVLYTSPNQPGATLSGKSRLGFRAPSTEQKCAWKSLIEQRVFAVRGSMEYYSSSSDVSSSSASAIVI
ncbi:RGS3-like protein [Mya arenaria]|uniref:RGS3-like protein n=1 Tax=Mya arenaria TaxID=6604 RepID=A0ABY7GBA7_MYAAR|nr:RGS3-like protein [Mya arenaria]